MSRQESGHMQCRKRLPAPFVPACIGTRQTRPPFSRGICTTTDQCIDPSALFWSFQCLFAMMYCAGLSVKVMAEKEEKAHRSHERGVLACCVTQHFTCKNSVTSDNARWRSNDVWAEAPSGLSASVECHMLCTWQCCRNSSQPSIMKLQTRHEKIHAATPSSLSANAQAILLQMV